MPREFEIVHRTEYTYSAPVFLEPHRVRLSPRPDYFTRLVHEETLVEPAPVGSARMIDENDNRVTQYWFAGDTTALSIESRLVVRLNEYNPFGILVHPPGAVRLPPEYPPEILPALHAALDSDEPAPAVRALADTLAAASNFDTLSFLERTARKLQGEYLYEVREEGPPRPAAETIELGAGSCRDLTLLYMEIARAMGLAARFVSGYTPAESGAVPDLHAWAEVFVPGGGWLGFDPSRGIALQGLHLPLASAPRPVDAAPVTGSFRGFANAQMNATISFRERFVF